MSSIQSIETPQDYVNYTFNLTTRGVTEVTSELTGMSSTVSNLVGLMAFKTSEYLSNTEAMLVGFGYAAAATFTTATQQAIRFEQALADVKAIGGETTDALAIGQAAMKYSNQFGMNVDAMTEGLEALSRAGLTATNVMSGILEEGVKLSKLEGMDLEDSINNLISTTNLLAEGGYDVNSQDYAEMVKAMNQHIVSTSESAPINAQNIIQTLQHVGGYASANKIDQDDLFAVIAQLGSKGTKGEMAGTALRAFIAAGQKDQAQRALKRIGLEPADLWDNTGEAMLPISEMKAILDNALETRGYSQQEKLEFYADFAGYKQANQIMKINVDEVQSYKENIAQAWDLGTKLDTILGTVNSNLQIISQTVKNFMTRVGSTMLPILNAVLQPIKWVVQLIDAMPFSEQIVGMGLTFLALKGLFIGVNRVVPAIASLYTSFSRQEKQVKGIRGHFRNLIKDAKEFKETIEHIKDPEWNATKRMQNDKSGMGAVEHSRAVAMTMYGALKGPEITGRTYNELSKYEQNTFVELVDSLGKDKALYQSIVNQIDEQNLALRDTISNLEPISLQEVTGSIPTSTTSNRDKNTNIAQKRAGAQEVSGEAKKGNQLNEANLKVLKDTFKDIQGLKQYIMAHTDVNTSQYDIGRGIMSIARPFSEVLADAFFRRKNTKEFKTDIGNVKFNKDIGAQATKEINNIFNNVRKSASDLPDISFYYNNNINEMKEKAQSLVKDITDVAEIFSNINFNDMHWYQGRRALKTFDVKAMGQIGINYSEMMNEAYIREVLKRTDFDKNSKFIKQIYDEQVDLLAESLEVDVSQISDKAQKLEKIHDKFQSKYNKKSIDDVVKGATQWYHKSLDERTNPSKSASKWLDNNSAKYLMDTLNIKYDASNTNMKEQFFKNIKTADLETKWVAQQLVFALQKSQTSGVYSGPEMDELESMITHLEALNQSINKLNGGILSYNGTIGVGSSRILVNDWLQNTILPNTKFTEPYDPTDIMGSLIDFLSNGNAILDKTLPTEGISLGGNILINDEIAHDKEPNHFNEEMFRVFIHEMAHSVLDHQMRRDNIAKSHNIPPSAAIDIMELEAVKVESAISKMFGIGTFSQQYKMAQYQETIDRKGLSKFVANDLVKDAISWMQVYMPSIVKKFTELMINTRYKDNNTYRQDIAKMTRTPLFYDDTPNVPDSQKIKNLKSKKEALEENIDKGQEFLNRDDVDPASREWKENEIKEWKEELESIKQQIAEEKADEIAKHMPQENVFDIIIKILNAINNNLVEFVRYTTQIKTKPRTTSLLKSLQTFTDKEVDYNNVIDDIKEKELEKLDNIPIQIGGGFYSGQAYVNQQELEKENTEKERQKHIDELKAIVNEPLITPSRFGNFDIYLSQVQAQQQQKEQAQKELDAIKEEEERPWREEQNRIYSNNKRMFDEATSLYGISQGMKKRNILSEPDIGWTDKYYLKHGTGNDAYIQYLNKQQYDKQQLASRIAAFKTGGGTRNPVKVFHKQNKEKNTNITPDLQLLDNLLDEGLISNEDYEAQLRELFEYKHPTKKHIKKKSKFDNLRFLTKFQQQTRQLVSSYEKIAQQMQDEEEHLYDFMNEQNVILNAIQDEIDTINQAYQDAKWGALTNRAKKGASGVESFHNALRNKTINDAIKSNQDFEANQERTPGLMLFATKRHLNTNFRTTKVGQELLAKVNKNIELTQKEVEHAIVLGYGNIITKDALNKVREGWVLSNIELEAIREIGYTEIIKLNDINKKILEETKETTKMDELIAQQREEDWKLLEKTRQSIKEKNTIGKYDLENAAAIQQADEVFNQTFKVKKSKKEPELISDTFYERNYPDTLSLEAINLQNAVNNALNTGFIEKSLKNGTSLTVDSINQADKDYIITRLKQGIDMRDIDISKAQELGLMNAQGQFIDKELERQRIQNNKQRNTELLNQERADIQNRLANKYRHPQEEDYQPKRNPIAGIRVRKRINDIEQERLDLQSKTTDVRSLLYNTPDKTAEYNNRLIQILHMVEKGHLESLQFMQSIPIQEMADNGLLGDFTLEVVKSIEKGNQNSALLLDKIPFESLGITDADADLFMSDTLRQQIVDVILKMYEDNKLTNQTLIDFLEVSKYYINNPSYQDLENKKQQDLEHQKELNKELQFFKDADYQADRLTHQAVVADAKKRERLDQKIEGPQIGAEDYQYIPIIDEDAMVRTGSSTFGRATEENLWKVRTLADANNNVQLTSGSTTDRESRKFLKDFEEIISDTKSSNKNTVTYFPPEQRRHPQYGFPLPKTSVTLHPVDPRTGHRLDGTKGKSDDFWDEISRMEDSYNDEEAYEKYWINFERQQKEQNEETLRKNLRIINKIKENESYKNAMNQQMLEDIAEAMTLEGLRYVYDSGNLDYFEEDVEKGLKEYNKYWDNLSNVQKQSDKKMLNIAEKITIHNKNVAEQNKKLVGLKITEDMDDKDVMRLLKDRKGLTDEFLNQPVYGVVKDIIYDTYQGYEDVVRSLIKRQEELVNALEHARQLNDQFRGDQELANENAYFVDDVTSASIYAGGVGAFGQTSEKAKNQGEQYDANESMFSSGMFDYQNYTTEQKRRELYPPSATELWAERQRDRVKGWGEKIQEVFSTVPGQSQIVRDKIGGVQTRLQGLLGPMESFNSSLESAAEIFPPLTIVSWGFNTALQFMYGITSALHFLQMLTNGEKIAEFLINELMIPAETAVTIGKMAETGATWLLTGAIGALQLLMSGPVLIAIGLVIAALAVLYISEQSHANALKESEKALKKSNQSMKSAIANYKSMRSARLGEQDATRKHMAALKESIALKKLETDRSKRLMDIDKNTKLKNDSTWGEYGLRAQFQKSRGWLSLLGGAGVLLDASAGEYKNTSEDHEGTSGQIRAILDSESAFGLFNSQYQNYVDTYYKQHAYDFGRMDQFAPQLQDLYGLETQLQRAYGTEGARDSEEFRRAVQEMANETGLSGEVIGQYLDQMQVEANVEYARTNAQSEFGRIQADASAAAMKVLYPETGNMNDQEALQYNMIMSAVNDEAYKAKRELFMNAIMEYVQAIVAVLTGDWGNIDNHINAGNEYIKGVGQINENQQRIAEESLEVGKANLRKDYGTKSYSFYGDTPFGGAVEAAHSMGMSVPSSGGAQSSNPISTQSNNSAGTSASTSASSQTALNTAYKSLNSASEALDATTTAPTSTDNQATGLGDIASGIVNKALDFAKHYDPIVAVIDSIFSDDNSNTSGTSQPNVNKYEININTININTEDDPTKIKTAFMNLMIEMSEQITPRQVSRTVGSTSNQNTNATTEGVDVNINNNNNNTNPTL